MYTLARLALLAAVSGAGAWAIARLCCEETVNRSTGSIRVNVRLALLRACTAPLTKLFARCSLSCCPTSCCMQPGHFNSFCAHGALRRSILTALHRGKSLALPPLSCEVTGLLCVGQLMRDLIRVCKLQQPAYQQHLPLIYLHTATNPLVLSLLTHPALPFVALG